MYFTKYPHRANFSFATEYESTSGKFRAGKREFVSQFEAFEGDLVHWSVSGGAFGDNLCLAPLTLPEAASGGRASLTKDGSFVLTGKSGKPLVTSVPDAGFGVSGESHMFQFNFSHEPQFYGMGEKNYGQIELSGLRTKFWTTDVWSDFHFAQWLDHPADPPYFATPYVAVKIGSEWVGFLLHNPYPTFMETPGTDESRVFVEWQRTAGSLIMGAEAGKPSLWVIYGPSLAELTQKLQKLIGTTPLPPVWSLGYHQSRWEYGGDKDLMRLDKAFAEHEFPCDGLWLDLDYMDGFRIFKTANEQFPKGVAATANKLAANGRRIVPIIDPGVKLDPGYSVYDDGKNHDVFCKNIEGFDYVGMVWPGETVFPDFSQARVRDWWSTYAAGFRKEGYGAAWLDMNDPSTGPVDPTGMRFDGGKLPHEAHHNQYALGMQIASREGFLQANPDERPFLLSRSGFIGSSRYSAIWTGDNMSSYYYLKMCIPTSLGLSLSGLPFSGPDVGGFGGNATEQLLTDWIKACCLFPFMRNHSVKDSKLQEPWEFSKKGLRTMRQFVRLRYKLLPYLYNLFIDQEENGNPILCPILYYFDDKRFLNTSDQFMVGESILQAPILDEKLRTRKVDLPKGVWFDARNGDWLSQTEVEVKPNSSESPIYIRNGAILAMQPGVPTDNTKNLMDIEFHIFVAPGTSGKTEYRYRADDGISFAYQTGKRSELVVSVEWNAKSVTAKVRQDKDGYGPIKHRLVVYGRDQIHGIATKPVSVRLAGGKLTAIGTQ